MNESDLYKELGVLTRNRDKWEDSIPYVSTLLSHDSIKIQAKALWLLGEMGFSYPASARDCIGKIVFFLDSDIICIRQFTVNEFVKISQLWYQLIDP